MANRFTQVSSHNILLNLKGESTEQNQVWGRPKCRPVAYPIVILLKDGNFKAFDKQCSKARSHCGYSYAIFVIHQLLHLLISLFSYSFGRLMITVPVLFQTLSFHQDKVCSDKKFLPQPFCHRDVPASKMHRQQISYFIFCLYPPYIRMEKDKHNTIASHNDSVISQFTKQAIPFGKCHSTQTNMDWG